ncbi:vesicle-associated protein 1-3 isoform X2 [Ananas comosus]|uniref:Vesicle-associated protein 1-3 isoform X2 n=1 Tax=Ananas comosus TaxID=4615 RepID=A0A6P5GV20_ANACO|nr:vesicle-associated protein 1-3 isoform X2 [Ananas comosus]
MSGGGLLEIQPNELKFPFELKKQSSCSMQLTNKTDQYVAFKVKTTNPKKYCVRPNTGVVSPGSTCDVTVTMQAQKEAPPDMQCKDKFLIQSVVAENGATPQDITPEVFNKETSKVIDECKLRVIYVPGNHPSPVHEESEEGTSPRSSMLENGGRTLFDSASRSNDEPVKEKSSEKVKKFRWSKRSNMSTQHDGKSNMNTQHDGAGHDFQVDPGEDFCHSAKSEAPPRVGTANERKRQASRWLLLHIFGACGSPGSSNRVSYQEDIEQIMSLG